MAVTYQGIIPPLVTPLLDRDKIDADGLQRLIEHVIAGGVHGIFLLGTTGEAPSLSYRLRRELIERSVHIVSGRIPVLVGITDTAFAESVALADHAADCGADALVVTTPYYFPAGQTELISYIESLLPELSLPLVLYNMPALTKVWFEIPTLEKLSEHANIVGVKDSSGDLDYFGRVTQLKTNRPDWSVMIGPEAMLASSMERGGDGAVAGGANIYPALFVDWYNACLVGDQTRMALLSDVVNQLQSIYSIGKYASRFIKATKCGLSLMGTCDDFMAEPFHRFRTPERLRVQAILDSLPVLATQTPST
jgi:4-hydroxy-tetrahydrodipicolinate synthase